MRKVLGIQMVNLKSQYKRLSAEIDAEIHACLEETQFIQGEKVFEFEKELAKFTSSKYVISCGNGTDALILACMALNFQKGDKVIVPAFTYIATVEALKILELKPIYCDVHLGHFMPTAELLDKVYTPDCKALVVVHLYGQCAEMESIMSWARGKNLKVIEDNAQSLGAVTKVDGLWMAAGTVGDVGTTSFFPSKVLGAYGDGGAVFCKEGELAQKIRMLANHGQSAKYIHQYVGLNSRLDTIQAAILKVKLKHLLDFIMTRRKIASWYDQELSEVSNLTIPYRVNSGNHVFHQYTIKVKEEEVRKELQIFLKEQGISTAIYYPMPIYQQEAYKEELHLPHTEELCKSVLSLPIHTEMTQREIHYICESIKLFFGGTA